MRRRPSANEIRSRMMSIAFKYVILPRDGRFADPFTREGLKIDAKAMDQLVEGSQSDVRQIINMLSTWRLSAEALDFDNGKKLCVPLSHEPVDTDSR